MEMPGRTFVLGGGYRYGFNGQEKDDESNGYNFGARVYDSRLGRWWSIDPEGKRHPENSTYSSFDNNPNIYGDLNGKDFIYLLDQDAVYGTGISGHSAMLIGDDERGWTMFTKTGENNPDGTAVFYAIHYKTLNDYVISNAQIQDDSRIELGFRIKTTSEQDDEMFGTAMSFAQKPYELKGHNCADYVRMAAEAGGVKMPELNTVAGITWPRTEYNETVALNKEGNNVLVFRMEQELTESIIEYEYNVNEPYEAAKAGRQRGIDWDLSPIIYSKPEAGSDQPTIHKANGTVPRTGTLGKWMAPWKNFDKVENNE
jgi:RHS repeat-associated protein